MSLKPASIKGHSFSASDRLLLDANFWFFLYGPQDPKDWKISVYSSALARMLTAKSTLYVDVLILSEFINRFARAEHAIAKNGGFAGKFKAFRQSPSYKQVAAAIADAVRRILRESQRVASEFETLDVAALLADFEANSRDFNDQVLAEICRTQNLIMVTDDSDFHALGVPILTANPKLLH